MRACSRDGKRLTLGIVLLALALGLPAMGIANATFGSSAAVTISITIAPTSPGPVEPVPTEPVPVETPADPAEPPTTDDDAAPPPVDPGAVARVAPAQE